MINPRLTWCYVPQTLPVPQPALLNEVPNAEALPPDSLEAKVETFLVMFRLLQLGQVTSPILLLLKTSFSNGLPHSAHANS